MEEVEERLMVDETVGEADPELLLPIQLPEERPRSLLGRAISNTINVVTTYPIELLILVLVSGVFGVAHQRAISSHGDEPWMRSNLAATAGVMTTTSTTTRNPRFQVFQVANTERLHQQESRCFTRCVRTYAQAHNYSYKVGDFVADQRNPFQIRIKPALIAVEMATIEYGDWLVYIDTDACIADQDRLFETIVAAAEERNGGQKCSFIAQDSPHVINAGFLMFRKDGVGDALAHAWNKSMPPGINPNFHDQFFLQFKLMEYAKADLPEYKNVHYKIPKLCDNACWEAWTKAAGLNTEGMGRFFGGACLVGGKGVDEYRINMHDWHWVQGMRKKDYLAGDFLFHRERETGKNKGVLPPELCPP
jgi:hypothetical protein